MVIVLHKMENAHTHVVIVRSPELQCLSLVSSRPGELSRSLSDCFPTMISVSIFVCSGRMAISLDRFIQVDIDDIFVGRIRMEIGDVLALVAAQKAIQKTVQDFKFVLGFSGTIARDGKSAFPPSFHPYPPRLI